jgi:DNA-binding transcriptional ArsR family regulator/uncharacterized protein YndB with AHSA1/START domain
VRDGAGDADLVWRALADPTRRAVLDLLRDGPRTTSDLAEAVPGLSRFAVMKHLGVLKDAGLVVVRADGRHRWHHLNGVPLREAYERWMAPFADRSADALLRLRHHVEGAPPIDPQHRGAPMSTPLTVTTMDIENEIPVAAPPDTVFRGLLEMAAWWPHRFRPDSQVHFEPHVGGRFWEEWEGGGTLYATVVALEPGVALELAGPMGVRGPVTARIRLAVEAAGDDSIVRWSHRAFGDVGEETREGYATGWGEVAAALAQHVGARSDHLSPASDLVM